MNLYDVRTDEQYGNTVPILADRYVLDQHGNLSFYVGESEVVATFRSHHWNHVVWIKDAEEDDE